MKKIVIVLVVLVLALLVAPWGVGKVAEKRLDYGLDKLVEQAPYLKVVERKWTRGWFKSEQVVTFENSAPGPTPERKAIKRPSTRKPSRSREGQAEPAAANSPRRRRRGDVGASAS